MHPPKKHLWKRKVLLLWQENHLIFGADASNTNSIFLCSVSRTHSQGHEDPAFGVGQFPHRGPSTNEPAGQRRASSGTVVLMH